jgi:hypothetical protein
MLLMLHTSELSSCRFTETNFIKASVKALNSFSSLIINSSDWLTSFSVSSLTIAVVAELLAKVAIDPFKE